MKTKQLPGQCLMPSYLRESDNFNKRQKMLRMGKS